MRFTSPLFLLLLFLIPLAWYLGWHKPVRRRDQVSLALRSLILLALIFALSGLEVLQRADRLAVVFLVDVSDSMPQQAIDASAVYIGSALENMGVDDRAAIVLFGGDALVERPMSALNQLAEFSSIPITNQTDMQEAIQLGLALFPSGYAKRMALLSDGAETTGDALAAARFASAIEAQIVVVPFLTSLSAEAMLRAVDAPTHIRSGEKFDLTVTVQSNQPMNAVLRVTSEGEVIYEGAHPLRKGIQTLALPLVAQDAPGGGFARYQVTLVPQQDAYSQNNRLETFSQISGAPRVLLVSPPAGEVLPGGEIRPDESSLLADALRAAGFELSEVLPSVMSADLPTLAQYQSVVLVNVPARELNQNQMEALRSYVRDLGGGLVAVGGPTSYGVGGYYGAPLEDALPVDMQIKDQQRRPQLTMLFIIDHSGSMGETSGGVMKLELAKEAAARSVELLFPNDRVGVIAFDDTASWVVPISTLADPARVVDAIAGIQLGGGTDIYAGLLAMSKKLADDPSKVKHVILLTDGGADVTGIPQLVKKLYDENGITLSTVGVGNDAADFLDELAELGGGRYHFTNNAGSIPSIFTEETMLASRAYIVEENFYPTLVNSSPILKGIPALPPLRGYVASSAKQLARVILESPKGDPILASWQYGLGHAVAFTSDATGRWARDWAQSDVFAPFWAQAVRSTMSATLNTTLQAEIKLRGEQARILLDAQDVQGNFLNGAEMKATLLSPGGQAQNLDFRQTAPGRYESSFLPAEQGIYLIRFSGKSDSAIVADTTGWALSYSPEYARIEPNLDLLLRLSQLSGGQVASPDPAAIFKHDLKAQPASLPAAPWLLLLAVCLLPLDIAARRLMVTQQDWQKIRGALKTSRRRADAPPPAEDLRLASLRRAKQRARKNAPEALALPAVESQPRENPPAAAQKTPPPQAESTTSALLARKKNKRGGN